MSRLLVPLVALHDRVFGRLEAALASWWPALLARVAFAAVLTGHYWAAALRRLAAGDAALTERMAEGGPLALGGAMLAAIAIIAELILPPLILLGLATRLAALGMATAVMLDLALALLMPTGGLPTLGGLFDTDPAGFADQRLLWLVPLMALMIRGGGQASIDALLAPHLAALVAGDPKGMQG